MIRSQVVVLDVLYDSDQTKLPPSQWDWGALIDEPIVNPVKVIAIGPTKNHPRLGDTSDE